jgi:CBS-domain-containing membrane protein
MLKDITRNRLVGGWFATVAVIIASVIAMGVNVSLSTTALLLTLSLVPPGIILALWRGAPPTTVGEVLYAANTPKEGRS